MADIFLSYSRADRTRVQPLVHTLEREGWTVWWDPTIVPGHEFHQLIESELASARCVIVAWSRTAVLSNWVIGEANEGLRRKVLVPVSLDDTLPPIPFRPVHTADLRNWSGDAGHPEMAQIKSGVRRLAGAPRRIDAVDDAQPAVAPNASPTGRRYVDSVAIPLVASAEAIARPGATSNHRVVAQAASAASGPGAQAGNYRGPSVTERPQPGARTPRGYGALYLLVSAVSGIAAAILMSTLFGSRWGVLGNLLAGLIGATAGGVLALFSDVRFGTGNPIVGNIVASTIGAVLAIFAARLL